MRKARAAIVCALVLAAVVPGSGSIAAEELLSSADRAAPQVASFLGGLGAAAGRLRTLDTPETLALMGLGADQGLNVFELLDAVYRWASPAGVRLALSGPNLREVSKAFDMGRERVRALLPFDLLIGLEIGAVLSPGQDALDASLAEPYEEYVEIGTIKLSTRFGFAGLEANRFSKPKGIAVSRFPFTTSLERLELYAPHKGAIYARGVLKPKRWNLMPIVKR